jgi:hypothetical protein
VDHELGESGDKDCDKTFDDEDPGPTGFSAFPAQVGDGAGKETTKGTGEGGGREENGHAETTFVSAIPEGNVPCYTWEEAAFCNTENHSDDKKASKVVDESHAGHG